MAIKLDYFFVFGLTVAGFVILYFGGAWVGKWLIRSDGGVIVDNRPLKSKQQYTEVKLSLISILMFGLITVITAFLVNMDVLKVSWLINWWILPLEVAALFVWNEIHFYICHRLLHTKWLYRRVHYLHHQSVTPTVYSTYSFHFIEALLLGSVMTTALFIYPFSIASLLTLPLMSITFNVLGHMNFDLFPGRPLKSLYGFTRRHSYHHSKNTGNYGFFLPYLDHIFSTEIRERER